MSDMSDAYYLSDHDGDRETRVTLRDLGDDFSAWWNHRLVFRKPGNVGLLEQTMRARWARDDGWSGGASAENLINWLRDGYEIDGFTFTDDDLASLRERPKFTWNDCEGDYHHDLFVSGVSECYQYKRNRPAIPGVTVEIELGTNSDTKGEAVVQWGAFVTRSLGALEAAGIDLAVYATMTTNALCRGWNRHRYVITCKRESEAMDYRYFSPIFSPAGFRVLGFFALIRAAELRKVTAIESLGYAPGNPIYSVRYVPERGVIRFQPSTEPDRAMDTNRLTAELLTALDESRKG